MRAIVAKHGGKAAPLDDLARMTTARAQQQFNIASKAMSAESKIVIQQSRFGVGAAVAGFFNMVRSLWPLGALLFIAIAPEKFMELLGWFWDEVVEPIIEDVGDAAKKAAEKVGKGLQEALGPIIPYVLGGGLILFGGSQVFRSR